jgi:hypothetical protein
MTAHQPSTTAGTLKPVRYSLRELLADIEANAVGLGGAGGRLLDQHEINRLFENGNSDYTPTTRD